ncbi:MAG: hypothetical protein ACRD6I_07105 [Candidatus Acidiferrales bacterium]
MVTVRLQRPFSGGPRVEVTVSIEPHRPFAIIPKHLLESIGVVPREQDDFDTSSGCVVRRGVAEARFFFHDHEAVSLVIFGEAGDPAILGFVTLATMGLEFDAANNELRSARRLISVLPLPITDSATSATSCSLRVDLCLPFRPA